MTYTNSLRVPFIFDDFDAITNNASLHRLWPIWDAFQGPDETTVAGRPVLNLSFAINYAISGSNVWSYHVGNILIHAGCACLVFGTLRRTFLSPPLKQQAGKAAYGLALAIAAIWAVHPLNTMCVTYIVQRAESLMSLCYLLTLYAIIRGANSSRPLAWQIVAVLAFLMGIGCKESIATAPIVAFIYDAIFLAGSFRNTLRQRGRLYVLLALCWIPLGLLVASGPRSQSTGLSLAGLTPWKYLCTQPQVLLHYLRLVAAPTPLCLDYDWQIAKNWGEIVGPGLVIALLVAATGWGVVRLRPWSFVGVWFFGTLAVSSSAVPIVIVASEHRMYLPSISPIAIVVLFGWSLSHRISLGSQKIVRFAAVMVVVGTFLWLAHTRNIDYQSELDVWRRVLEIRPTNSRALTNYGAALEAKGRLAEAVPFLEQSVRLSPDYGAAHYNFGVGLAKSGRINEAVTEFRESVRINPKDASAQYNLGFGLIKQHKPAEAEAHLRQAIAAYPAHAAARNELAALLVARGRSKEAIEHLRIAVQLQTADAAPRNTLAWILATDPDAALRDGTEAVRMAEQARELAIENASALDTLAAAYAESGRFDEAIATAQSALAASEVQRDLSLAASIRERITLYQAGRPYRSAPPAAER